MIHLTTLNQQVNCDNKIIYYDNSFLQKERKVK